MLQSFFAAISGKALLDIGGGPVPAAMFWKCQSRSIVIDPLYDRYSEAVARLFPNNWWTGIEKHPVKAEQFVPELSHAIDGAIICRNCLDHCAEPYLILSNIASYAAPDCLLLLWSDLFHLKGHDHGHRNITMDKIGFARLVDNLGFEIIRETTDHKNRGTIEFGCVARKRR